MAKKFYRTKLVLNTIIANRLTIFDFVKGSKNVNLGFIGSVTVLVGILLFLFDKLVIKKARINQRKEGIFCMKIDDNVG